MSTQQTNSMPAARSEGLVIEEIDGELLIYDLDNHRSHCLNPTAALVWKRCDGKTSAAEIALRLSDSLGTPFDEGLVWFALDKLGKRKLLREPRPKAGGPPNPSRRAMLKRAGAVAVMIPLITTITAPTAYASVSCGGSCDNANPCRTGCVCVGGTCVPQN